MPRKRRQREGDPVPPPEMYREGQPVYFGFTRDLNDALGLAEAADRLGYGWRIDTYHAPFSDTESRREYRVIAWSEVTSDASMIPA